MQKYGIEHFSIELIEETNNPEERESFWIEYYGSFKNGYNATMGGDGRKYIDYDLVVATYNQLGNVKETAKQLNISADSVSSILHIKNIAVKTGAQVLQEKYGKIIDMFSLDGKYLRTFPSTNAAARYMVENNLTGCKTSTIKQHIHEVCEGRRKTAAKYKWKYG